MWVLMSLGVGWLVIGLGFDGADRFWLLLAAVLVTATGAIFRRLSVSVDGVQVRAAFGWGWPRRRVAIAEVVAARHVRTSWWQGLGIRKVRNGWMFNNSGRDAIELRLRSGAVFLIGTDQPTELLGSLVRVLPAR